jgi:hypothetical protein
MSYGFGYGFFSVLGWTHLCSWWGSFSPSSCLQWRNLQQNNVVVIIISATSGVGGHLHHQVLTSAIATHHKHIIFRCRTWVLERAQDIATFAPAAPEPGSPTSQQRLHQSALAQWSWQRGVQYCCNIQR